MNHRHSEATEVPTMRSDMSWDDLQIDAHGRLVDVTQRAEPGPPPDLTWVELELYALTVATIFGRGVTVSDHRGVEHNLVAASEIFTDGAGAWVHLVTYDHFCAWGRIPADQRPRTPTPARAVAAKHVWVMHEKPTQTGSAGGSSAAEGSGAATSPLPPL